MSGDEGEAFDAIIIGTGQAGPALAGRLTAAGRRVAIIERGCFGGTCVNTGCTPTKTMVASAYVARLLARGAEFGVVLEHPFRIDLPAVVARASGIAESHRAGVERGLESMDGCTVLRGHARFEGPCLVRAGPRLLTAPSIFINVGGRAIVPDMPGITAIPTMTNADIVTLTELPRHLAIIGGSYIGLEFAQMFRRFGAEVTVVERSERLLPREDERISAAIRSILENEGVRLRLGSDCVRFAAHSDGAVVTAAHQGAAEEIVASHVLLAVGRRPNTDDLGLERAGIATDLRGFIQVDDHLRTNVAGVWALGDCNGRGAFTHTAWNDYEIVAANELDGASRSVAERVPAYALYIDPPLGRAGLTEVQARAAGHRVRVGVRPMTQVARAVEKGESQGLMSVVVDADTDAILGAAILGPGGDEAIHGVLDMIAAKLPAAALARIMPIHPTVSELIPTVLGELSPAD